MSAPIIRYVQPRPMTRVESVLALGELCKARLSSLVLATAGAGYVLALPAGEAIFTLAVWRVARAWRWKGRQASPHVQLP